MPIECAITRVFAQLLYCSFTLRRHVERQSKPIEAGKVRFRKAGSTLIECDHVRDLAQRHEQWKPRASGSTNARPAWSTCEIDDRRPRVLRRTLETDKGEFDQVALWVGAVFRDEERAEFRIDLFLLIGLERVRLDFQCVRSWLG